MTIAMPDSIYPDRLPPGYRAYLGYSDGNYATESRLRARFPGAWLVIYTVTGSTTDTHGIKIAAGIDDEPGNPDSAEAVRWVLAKLAQDKSSRPIVYADLASPGYAMAEVISGLSAAGVTRDRYRVHTAHYTGNAHICGPGSCGELAVDADGTQWTSSFAGVGGLSIDMSELADDFFGAVQTTVEVDVQLQVLKQGDSGQAVRNWQGLLVSHGYGYMISMQGATSVEALAGVDGVFGAKTHAATVQLQHDLGVSGDPAGTVGAATWARVLA